MRLVTYLVLTTSLLLAACGPAPEQKAEMLLAQNDTAAVTSLMNEALAENPQSPYFNGLKALELFADCLASDCGQTNPVKLTQLNKHLSLVPAEVIISETQKRHFYNDLAQQMAGYALQHPMSQGLQNIIVQALPKTAPVEAIAAILADEAYTNLLNAKLAPTTQLLAAITTLGPEAHSQGANLVNAMLTGNLAPLTAPAPESLPHLYLTMLPAAMLEQLKQTQPSGYAEAFLNTLKSQPLTLSNTPLNVISTPAQRAAFGQGIADLASTETYAKNLGALLPANPQVANPSAYAQALTLKAALVYNPEATSLWQQVVPAALAAMQPEAPLSLIYDGFDLAQVPAPIVTANNELLLAQMDKNIAAGHSLLPLLKEMIYRPDANQDRFTQEVDARVGKALEAAITQKNTDIILAYVQDQSGLINGRETQVGEALRDGMVDQWQKNDFKDLKTIAELLQGRLRVGNFNFEQQVTTWFTEYLTSDKIKAKTTANTLTDLNLALDEAAISLEPKLTFVKEILASQPQLVQTQLQASASEAAGPYGAARTLMAFYPVLDKNKRDALLTNAITLGLNRDEALPPEQIASAASQFLTLNPTLPAEAYVVAMVDRAKELPQARTTWAAASPELKALTTKLKPQFSALMLAIDAHEAGNKAEAATQFALVTEEPYLGYAKPFVDEYRALLAPYAGDYVRTDRLGGSLAVIALSLTPGEALMTARLGLVNAVGNLKAVQGLVADYGSVVKSNTLAKLQPKTMTLTPDTNARDAGLGSFSFEKAFGPLQTLTLGQEALDITLADGSKHRFKRQPLAAPQGRFRVDTATTNNPEAAHLLPPGTLITFTPDGGEVTLGDGQKVAFTSRFTAATQQVDFTFPYSAVATPGTNPSRFEAVVRCQIVTGHGVCASHNKHWAKERFSHQVLLSPAP